MQKNLLVSFTFANVEHLILFAVDYGPLHSLITFSEYISQLRSGNSSVIQKLVCNLQRTIIISIILFIFNREKFLALLNDEKPIHFYFAYVLRQ